MTYALTFITGLATLCLLVAIPYVIGVVVCNLDEQRDVNAYGKFLIGLLTTLLASLLLVSVYILGVAVMDFLTK